MAVLCVCTPVDWPHKDGKTWSMEVIVADDLYWKLVKLGADFKQTPGEYVAMVMAGEVYSSEEAAEALDKHLGAL